MNKVSKGEVYYVDIRDHMGSEQGGHRPMVVVQNDIGNKYSPTTIVAPLTTKLKREMPTHVKIGSLERHNMRPSTIMLEHIRTVDKSRLGKYVTKLNDSIIRRIDKAIAISFGIDGSAFGN